MHCPKCGQQQLSEEVRFCSRCGFPLEGVSRLVAAGGALPATAPPSPAVLTTAQAELTAKQRGTRQGAKIVFWSVVLVPIFITLSSVFDSPGPLAPPFILFLAGLVRILYARLFGEDLAFIDRLPRGGRRGRKVAPVTETAAGQDGGAGAARGALPASQRAPFADPFPPRMQTAEMVYPPASVTEQTTQLLDDH